MLVVFDRRIPAAEAVPRARPLLALLLTAGLFHAPGASAAQAGCTTPLAGGEWPFYGHDLQNTRSQPDGRALDPSTAPTLTPAWTFSSHAAGGSGDFTGTPVVADGCVFVGSNQGWMFAIDERSGHPVWKTKVPRGGVMNNSLGVSNGRVYAFVSKVGHPYVIAVDEHTGQPLWDTVIDHQDGADAFSSPVVYDGMVFVGISGDAAQHGKADERAGFHGSFVLLDATTGRILAKTWTIPRTTWNKGYAGGTVTPVPAFDPRTGTAYAGTGNAFVPQKQAANTDAILKIDVDRSSPSFGRIVDSYKADTLDDFVPGYTSLPCTTLPIPPPPPIVPAGRGVGACGEIDVKFEASPNLFTVHGRTLIGESQKSGAYHVVDATTMHRVWRTTWGPPQQYGGVSTAYADGTIYGAGAPGHVFALDAATGAIEWVTPFGDGAHYGQPVAESRGVVFTADLRGFLDGFDAGTGVPLLAYPLAAALGSTSASGLTFGGVSAAGDQVFVSVGIQDTGLDPTGDVDGVVIAFRSGLPGGLR